MDDYIFPPPSSLPPGSTIIVYARDSGGPAQEESIGQQERVFADYCKKYGLVLIRTYAETASGRKTKNRKEFLRMIEDVLNTPKDLRPRGLLLWSTSRFARNLKQFNRNFYTLLDEGLIIHSLTEQFPEGISGHLLLSIAAYTHEKFSEDLGKNIKRGIADRVKAGYCNGGQAPKGYQVIKDDSGRRRDGHTRSGVKWIPDPEIAPLVLLAWELRAQGKSYGEITKATGGKVYTNRGSWITHYKNKSYLGIGKAGDLEIPDHHEALITWELWDAVQVLEKERDTTFHYKRLSNPSLLAGLARCLHCGAAMVLHTDKKYRSYTCGKRDRQRGFSVCTQARRVNARKAERVVLDAIRNKILSPKFVNDWIADIQSQMTDVNDFDRMIGETNKTLISTERSITRLLQLAEGTGEIEEITSRLINLKRDKVELESKIKILKARQDANNPQITPEALALAFAEIGQQIDEALQRGELLTAKKIIGGFVQKIELSNKNAIIHYVNPLGIIHAESVKGVSAHKESCESGILHF
jgi:DNA invertase Pin-like site-specific DNA recombinase